LSKKEALFFGFCSGFLRDLFLKWVLFRNKARTRVEFGWKEGGVVGLFLGMWETVKWVQIFYLFLGYVGFNK